MLTAKLSSKHQITIPKAVLQQLGLAPGDRLLLEIEEDKIILKTPPRMRRPTETLYGSIRANIDAVEVIRDFRKTGGRT